MDQQKMKELMKFLEYAHNNEEIEKITTRALSILLYNDSKSAKKQKQFLS